MEDIQRTQILEAVAALVAEHGVAGVTVAEATARAGVSRRAVQERFPDVETCLVGAFELGLERVEGRMTRAYTSESRWRDGVRAALAEGLRFLDEEPAFARLLIVHSLSDGPELMRRRVETQAVLREVVDRGRWERASRRAEPPPIVAEGVVGAVLAVIQTRLLAQDASPADERSTIELFGSLMSLIVLPYLGPSAAKRELLRPAPSPRRGGGGPEGSPSHFDDYGVRLTYRTGRVLSAIARYPGASNREVAERAGIVDQGQVSKLLTRLERAGVVANLNKGKSRGGPKAWKLTELGERVERGTEERFGSDERFGSTPRTRDVMD